MEKETQRLAVAAFLAVIAVSAVPTTRADNLEEASQSSGEKFGRRQDSGSTDGSGSAVSAANASGQGYQGNYTGGERRLNADGVEVPLDSAATTADAKKKPKEGDSQRSAFVGTMAVAGTLTGLAVGGVVAGTILAPIAIAGAVAGGVIWGVGALIATF